MYIDPIMSAYFVAVSWNSPFCTTEYWTLVPLCLQKLKMWILPEEACRIGGSHAQSREEQRRGGRPHVWDRADLAVLPHATSHDTREWIEHTWAVRHICEHVHALAGECYISLRANVKNVLSLLSNLQFWMSMFTQSYTYQLSKLMQIAEEPWVTKPSQDRADIAVSWIDISFFNFSNSK